MKKNLKPTKKTDKELFRLLTEKIAMKEYIFLVHAKKRLKDRNISDLDVLWILEGKEGYRRERNKQKDKYEVGKEDWNYCIEGVNLDGVRIRIIISFENNSMPIITVIRITD